MTGGGQRFSGPPAPAVSKAQLRAALDRYMQSPAVQKQIQRRPGGNGGNGQRRNQQNVRARAAALRFNAGLRSIPKRAPTKEERYTQGALRNTLFAPRGQGYYDAFVQTPDSAILSAAVGPVTPVTGSGRESIPARIPQSVAGQFFIPAAAQWNGMPTGFTMSPADVSRDNSTLILLNPGASGDVVGWICHPVVTASGGTMSIRTEAITVPQFQDFGPTVSLKMRPNNVIFETALDRAEDLDTDNNTHTHEVAVGPGGRIENIPLRLSMQLRNTTAAMDVGGMVRVLRYNGGLTLSASESRGPGGVPVHEAGGATQTSAPPITDEVDLVQYMLLKDMIRKASRTRHLSGSELCTPFQTNCYPADAVRSMTFEATRDFELALREPSYNTTLILIDDFESTSGKNNSYELVLSAQRAARYSPGTPMHSLARTLRSHPQHHSAKSYEEATKPGGNFLTQVGDTIKGGWELATAHPELIQFGHTALKAALQTRGIKIP